MVRAGWAQIFGFDSDFQRLPAYLAIRQTAERFPRGSFFSVVAGSMKRRPATNLYNGGGRRLRSSGATTGESPAIASALRGGMLSRRVRSDFGPFRSWKVGYLRSLRTTVPFARARLSGRRAVVSVRLRARDRDACSGRVVQQRFRGKWTLATRRDSWVGVKVRMRKTGGGRPRLSRTECAPYPSASSTSSPAWAAEELPGLHPVPATRPGRGLRWRLRGRTPLRQWTGVCQGQRSVRP
jgi:hypothetical protein